MIVNKVINFNTAMPLYGYVLLVIFFVIFIIFSCWYWIYSKAVDLRSSIFVASLFVMFVYCLREFYPGNQHYNNLQKIIIKNNILSIKTASAGIKDCKLSDILSIQAYVNLHEQTTFVADRKVDSTCTNLELVINLRNGSKIKYEETFDPGFFRASYHFVYELVRLSKLVPKLKIELSATGGNYVLDKLNYFCKHNKKRPFWLSPYWTSMHISIRIFIIILAIMWIIAVLYVSVYEIKDKSEMYKYTTKAERNYLKKFDKAHTIKNIDKNCNLAIREFNEAEKIINTSADSYLQKAYCYAYLGNYEKAISEARFALKYSDSRAISDKFSIHPFIVNSDGFANTTKEAIWNVIAESSYKIGDYKTAAIAYKEVIDNKSTRYIDEYFRLGLSEYALGNYIDAKKNIQKHKDIVSECLNSGRYNGEVCYSYNKTYLESISTWVKNCEHQVVVLMPQFKIELKY